MDNKLKRLADVVFPNINKSIEYYENLYPPRESKGKVVTRFAPSPTGYMHIGGLYVSLINQSFAQKQDGTFYLRIEDTDQSRILDNGVTEIINTLNNYDIQFDEGPVSETEDFGAYGPYRQSDRKEIYQTYAKFLIEEGKAYPCFCSKEELESIREEQVSSNSSIIGYAGKYAKCRNLSPEEAIKRIENGEKFVVRMKSPVTESSRVVVKDIVRGEISTEDNYIDIVIIKGDGLPTYHFAHVIDDHLMHTTHVIRADEWIASLPMHVQMFKMLGFEVPQYAHVCAILKMDGDSKRKLSKRKDPEARVGFYFEQGYPVVAVKEYLLNLINSRFETWREQNPTTSYKDFEIKLNEMSKSGALFDLAKLSNVSKKIIKSMTDEEVMSQVLTWSKTNSPQFYDYIQSNPEKFLQSITIWHKNRMDIAKWNEIETQFSYLYDCDFKNKLTAENELCKMPHFEEILADYLNDYDFNDDSTAWFDKVKVITDKYNYAVKPKEYKLNPEKYNGSIVDVSAMLRVALTGKKDSPDIYQISQYLGKNEVLERVQTMLALVKNAK